ncbi:MAG: caspase family protein [Microscillaceae bacterium]|nr:caspase family protein [Microscillaceae bacterium]
MSSKPNKIFALLVGINQYHPESIQRISTLEGCVNDVEAMSAMLKKYLPQCLKKNYVLIQKSDEEILSEFLHIKTLTDQEASRQNIIDTFRSHLRDHAGPDTTVLFHYSGHGSYQKTSLDFYEYTASKQKKEETIVCYDSRTKHGHDLADKEMAILIEEVSKKGAQVIIILDCCHSGSGTREEGDFMLGDARQCPDEDTPRGIKTYLDDYYEKQKKQEGKVSIPQSPHVLFAACQHEEVAYETKEGTKHGMFTKTLLGVMEQYMSREGQITYSDLFMEAKKHILRFHKKQTPKFESYGFFNAQSLFLTPKTVDKPESRYEIIHENGSWVFDFGATQGLPKDVDNQVFVSIYPDKESSEVLGKASVRTVKITQSTLSLVEGTQIDEGKTYYGEIVSFPMPKMLVYLNSDENPNCQELFIKTFKDFKSPYLDFTFDSLELEKYKVVCTTETVEIWHEKQLKHQTSSCNQEGIQEILSALELIARWERLLKVENRGEVLNLDDVEFAFYEGKENLALHTGENIKIYSQKDRYYTQANFEWLVPYALKGKNKTGQDLFFTLLYFSPDFGIEVYFNEKVSANSDEIILTNKYGINPREHHEVTDVFKLIVSTVELESYSFQQEGIKNQQVKRSELLPDANYKKIEDWFTKTIVVNVVKQLDEISANKPVQVAHEKITLQPHPVFHAKIALKSAVPHTRSVDSDIAVVPNLFAAHPNLELINFSGERNLEDQSVLEISNFTDQQAESLAENPLVITLHQELSEEEYILPLTFDGEFILPAGEFQKNDQGETVLKIHHISAQTQEESDQRSLTSALKLYFFKVIGKNDPLWNLSRIEFLQNGTFEKRQDQIVEKVSEAKKVLLFIHGIIGNTDWMIKGLDFVKNQNKYDLVLSFDYENLGTTIDQIAAKFKEKLTTVGFNAQDSKELTIVAHSMGGLVSRYLIEKLQGDEFVDTLILAGTPNKGSAFGSIPHFIKLFTWNNIVLSLNAGEFLPSVAGLLAALRQSKTSIFTTLAQMNPQDDFIGSLNQPFSGSSPKTQYIVIAGNTTNYQSEGSFFPRLLDKLFVMLGKIYREEGNIFKTKPNDVAVATESILDLPPFDQVQKHEVACHHNLYFKHKDSLSIFKELLG